MTEPRTGVLGGTFDPIHLGHHDLALAAQRALALDRVLLVPSRVPPHRTPGPVASAAERLHMVRLMAAAHAELDASDVEIQSSGPSYTASTLERLGTREPGQFFFITGADAFADIATWYRYPDVLDLSHFVVVSRPGHPVSRLPELLPELETRMRTVAEATTSARGPWIWLVDARTRDISSSDIRARLATGRPVEALLDPQVSDYIARRDLYGAASADPALHD